MANNHLVLLPILIPLTAAMVALLLRRQPQLQAGWTLGALLVALASRLPASFTPWAARTR